MLLINRLLTKTGMHTAQWTQSTELTSSLKACSCAAVLSESDSSSKFSSFIATSPCHFPLYKTMTAVKHFTTQTHAHTRFCRPSFPELLQVRPVPKSKLLGMLLQNFYRPDTLPVAQPKASKQWRMTVLVTEDSMLSPCCQDRSETLWWLCGLRQHASCEYNISVPDLETTWCQHTVVVSQEHCYDSTFYRPDALPVTFSIIA